MTFFPVKQTCATTLCLLFPADVARCTERRRRSELVGLGEVDDGAGGGGRDDDVVGDGLEARDDPLGEERAHGEAEEDEEDVRGGPAEGEAVHLEDTRCDLLELLRGQVARVPGVGLLRLPGNSKRNERSIYTLLFILGPL